MDYWNEIITKKSWEKLVELKRKKIDFVVIGGWAAWLWTRTHKSKDIDILVSITELQKIKYLFELKKNDRLKKYEINLDEIDVGIYVPFYSKLAMSLEEVMQNAVQINGFKTAGAEELLVLKQAAELDRKHSEKGLKDRVDIMSLLLYSAVDIKKYVLLLKKNQKEHFKNRLIEIVQSFREAQYVNLNLKQLKTKRQLLLEEIKTAN